MKYSHRSFRSLNTAGKRHSRRDKGKPRWTERDYYCLEWIGEQRAIRFNQLQRLLAREAEQETPTPARLSYSRTTKLLKRWEKADLVYYKQVHVHQPGWIWLTRRGLHFVDLDYRYSVPAESTLMHLYYINQLRLYLEDHYDDEEMEWVSERALLAEQGQRQSDTALAHLPDGIAIFKNGEQWDMEVELSRKNQHDLQAILRGGESMLDEVHPVRYYVAPEVKSTVLNAFRTLMHTTGSFRSHIEIFDLHDLDG